LGSILLLDLFITRSFVDSCANPTHDASRGCQFFLITTVAANRNGLIPDDEALILYSDAKCVAKTVICAECASGCGFQAAGRRRLKRQAASSRLQEFILRVNSPKTFELTYVKPS
jgi:hypothetical protein